MEHRLFSDGNQKKISWIIQTGESTEHEERIHVDEYMDKVTNEQSKYITLHVGIFWGIGRFVIKNEDTVDVMLDSESMYNHLHNNAEISDEFIEKRTWFIKELINQRKLKIRYHLIEPKENLASEFLSED
jgi:hypothetical protein